MKPKVELTYPPLDRLKPVTAGLWIVDSGPFRVLGGFQIPVRMTVVRLRDGSMWLHSPTRYDRDLHASIEQIGPIRHLVGPNTVHWSFLQAWKFACPDALIWAAPGLESRRSVRDAGLRVDRELDMIAPAEWSLDLDQTILRAFWDVSEVAFLHRASRTLVLTDLIENFEPRKLPMLARPLMRMLGTLAPDGATPLHFRLIIWLKRHVARRAARQLLAWRPERVIFAHGRWFERDGAVQLERALHWLVG